MDRANDSASLTESIGEELNRLAAWLQMWFTFAWSMIVVAAISFGQLHLPPPLCHLPKGLH